MFAVAFCYESIGYHCAKVERVKGGNHQGLALKLTEKSPLNVGGTSPTSSDNLGGPQVPENAEDPRHPPTSPTLNGDTDVEHKISSDEEREIDRLAAADGWNPRDDEHKTK
jgi:hypothetical protein